MIRWSRIGVYTPCVIALVGILAYLNSLASPFIFDDVTAITDNRNIGRLLPMVFSTRWVVDLTFRLNYTLGGFNVTDYRAVNLVIHIACALLLFGIIRRTLKLPRLHERFAGSATGLAAATALFFVAHPLQTASVTYVCQRYESVMALCLLATLYTFIRAVTSSASRKSMAWALLAVSVCLLGMGTKEVMLAAPFVVLTYDWVFLRDRLPRNTRRLRIGLHMGLFLTLVALTIMELRMLMIMARQGHGIAGKATPWIYLATQTEVILHYLRLSIWPSGQCLDYAWPLAAGWGDVWPAAAVVIGLGCATVYAIVRRRSWGFPAAGFFLVLGPSSSLMPAPDAAFEHRMYLPLAAVLSGLVIAGYLVLRPLVTRTRQAALVWLVIVVGLTAALGVTTHQRNKAYASQEVMWRDVMSKQPGNYRQRLALFYTLFERGDGSEAETVIRDLIADTKAGFDSKESSPTPGRDPFYYHALAQAQLGRLILHAGDAAAAIDPLAIAIRALPAHAAAHRNMALARGVLGRYEEARRAAAEALRRDPNEPRSHMVLALLCVYRSEFQAAAGHYRRAMALLPPPHLALNLQLGWLLATAPDPAVRNGAEAEQLALAVHHAAGHRSVRALDVLAAALAEQGRYGAAVQRLEQALTMASAPRAAHTLAGDAAVPDGLRRGGPSTDRAKLRARKSLYEKHLPYRPDL